jgi:CheY-like chemotaxis protein
VYFVKVLFTLVDIIYSKGYNMFPNLEKLLEVSKNLKVLYVEDSQDARVQTTKLLNNFFDDIVTAVDGADGLTKYLENNNSFDLVISDINMPNLDGIKMSKAILELDDKQLIIIITAHNEEEHIKQLEDLNVTAYIHKPIDFKLLIDTLETTIKIHQKRNLITI